MPERHESDSLRCIVERLVHGARRELGLSATALRQVLATPPHARSVGPQCPYQAVASLADTLMNRRPLAEGVVDGFYSSARRGGVGEALFAGGADALSMHGYAGDAIGQLPPAAVSRFLGLGNVWIGLDPSRGRTVIDVGCGSGVDLGVAAYSCPPGAFLVGVDKRPDLLTVAAAACPQASFLVGDITALPLAGATFDIVLANGLPPLQRPTTLGDTVAALHALAAPGGRISATVILASPTFTSMIADVLPDNDLVFAGGLATLISGKPTAHDMVTAFAELGSVSTLRLGTNPYRSHSARRRTDLFNVCAEVS